MACSCAPLYRQQKIYERFGVELSRATMAAWVGGARGLLAPLVEELRRYALGNGKLHAEDTPVPVLAPGLGETKTGHLWTYVRDDRPAGDRASPAVWFAYSPDRQGKHPQQHLRDYRGKLQADAFAGFNALYEDAQREEVGCWARVRRTFYDLQVTHTSPLAKEALERIGKLYDIERAIRGRLPEERQQVRQQQARPLLDSLYRWLQEALTKLSKKSAPTTAVNYALRQWPALLRYCNDGRLEIDNNAAERALRAVALGRKNYLFAGSDAGGERTAAMYTPIGTAKLNEIDPEAYLRYLLERPQVNLVAFVLSAQRRVIAQTPPAREIRPGNRPFGPEKWPGHLEGGPYFGHFGATGAARDASNGSRAGGSRLDGCTLTTGSIKSLPMSNREVPWRLLTPVLLAAIIGVIAPSAGKWLVINAPRRSDVIVVLSGDFGGIRFQHALKLLRGGYAQELVLDAPDWIEYGRTASDLAQAYVRNVAPEMAAQIRVCSFHEDSTLGELREVAPCIRAVAPDATTAIVVTSDFHTRRALSIARHALPEYQWSVAAAPDSRFGIAWWRHREWAKTTVSEWQKSCWWYIVEQWSTHI